MALSTTTFALLCLLLNQHRYSKNSFFILFILGLARGESFKTKRFCRVGTALGMFTSKGNNGREFICKKDG
uniref:Secreted protein n=1 Tax=Globodera rostochiensis TaxID=31243 RepID=A0A914IAX5_GLORO